MCACVNHINDFMAKQKEQFMAVNCVVFTYAKTVTSKAPFVIHYARTKIIICNNLLNFLWNK